MDAPATEDGLDDTFAALLAAARDPAGDAAFTALLARHAPDDVEPVLAPLFGAQAAAKMAAFHAWLKGSAKSSRLRIGTLLRAAVKQRAITRTSKPGMKPKFKKGKQRKRVLARLEQEVEIATEPADIARLVPDATEALATALAGRIGRVGLAVGEQAVVFADWIHDGAAWVYVGPLAWLAPSEATPAALAREVLHALRGAASPFPDDTTVWIEHWMLPDPPAAFVRWFGLDLGLRLAAGYKDLEDGMRGGLFAVFRDALSGGRHEVSIAYSDDPASADLNDAQRAALGAMTVKLPLWTFTLHPREAQVGVQVFSFVHDGDAFRYVGKLAGETSEQTPS